MADRYAYLGPEGTFTEAALAAFDPAALDGAIACPTVQAKLDAVRGGEADRAIVTIEKTTSASLRLFLEEGADCVGRSFSGSYLVQNPRIGYLVTAGAPSLRVGTPRPSASPSKPGALAPSHPTSWLSCRTCSG